MANVPTRKKHTKKVVGFKEKLPRIFNRIALDQLEREEIEAAAYLRVFDVPTEGYPSSS